MTSFDPTTSPRGASPGDDRTYNVLQALASTLEAIDAYEMYAQDDNDGVFHELLHDERRHADRLLDELRACLLPAGQPPAGPHIARP